MLVLVAVGMGIAVWAGGISKEETVQGYLQKKGVERELCVSSADNGLLDPFAQDFMVLVRSKKPLYDALLVVSQSSNVLLTEPRFKDELTSWKGVVAAVRVQRGHRYCLLVYGNLKLSEDDEQAISGINRAWRARRLTPLEAGARLGEFFKPPVREAAEQKEPTAPVPEVDGGTLVQEIDQ